MSCGVGCRCNSDPVLLWLWCRPAAVALIGPLAREPPYAKGAALTPPHKKNTKKTKKPYHMIQQSHSWTPGHTWTKLQFKKIHAPPMSIATHIHIAKTWKQPECPLTDEWIKRMWCIYTMEYYSAIKKNKIMPFAATWMQLEILITK